MRTTTTSSTRLRPLLVALGGIILVVPAACGGSDRDTSEAEATRPSSEAPESASTTPDDPQQLIAYQTVRGGGEGVWLINRDGTDGHRVAADAGDEQLLPDWSSDGARVVFATRGGPTEPLYVYDVERDAATQLFDCTDPCLGDDEPAFSPNDSKVAFIRALGPITDDKPADCGLWIGEVATGEVEQITSHPGCDPRETSPRWSADGTQLPYWSEQYSESGDVTGTAVFVVNADGSGTRQLTDWSINAGDADWSPDGEWIVYATHPLRNYGSGVESDLFRIHPDGSGTEQLTQLEDVGERATQPRYAPDGTQILFTLVTGSRSLALVAADGGEVERITGSGIYTHGVMQPTSD